MSRPKGGAEGKPQVVFPLSMPKILFQFFPYKTGRRGRRPLPWVGGIAVTFVGEGLAPAVFDEGFFSYIMDRRGRRSLQFIGCEHRSFDRYTATICGME